MEQPGSADECVETLGLVLGYFSIDVNIMAARKAEQRQLDRRHTSADGFYGSRLCPAGGEGKQ